MFFEKNIGGPVNFLKINLERELISHFVSGFFFTALDFFIDREQN